MIELDSIRAFDVAFLVSLVSLEGNIDVSRKFRGRKITSTRQSRRLACLPAQGVSNDRYLTFVVLVRASTSGSASVIVAVQVITPVSPAVNGLNNSVVLAFLLAKAGTICDSL